MNPIWSWGLCILGSIGLFMAGRRHWWSWLILLFNEVLWIVYGTVTGQHGFIAAAIIYGIVYVKNLRDWRSRSKIPPMQSDEGAVLRAHIRQLEKKNALLSKERQLAYDEIAILSVKIAQSGI